RPSLPAPVVVELSFRILGSIVPNCGDGVLDTLLRNQTRVHLTSAAWPKRRRVPVEVFGEVRDRLQLVGGQLELIHVPPLLFGERRDQVEGIEMAETRSQEHTSELQSRFDLVCRHLLEKKKHAHE